MKYIGQFFQDIGQFFQDDSTQRFSAMRLVLLAWALGTLTTWGYVSFKKGEVQNLPQPVQVVLLALLTGKVVQKFGEKSSTTTADGQSSIEPTSPSTDSDAAITQALTSPQAASNGHAEQNGNQAVPNIQEGATPASA